MVITIMVKKLVNGRSILGKIMIYHGNKCTLVSLTNSGGGSYNE